MSYTEHITGNRMKKDKFFKESPHSPLTPQQKETFQELTYFPADEKYSFKVNLKQFSQQDTIDIMTSKGQVQKYIRYGHIEFEIDSETYMLTVFKQPNSDYFFVPFKDKTTGNETYSAGRYVEIEKESENNYELDFNTAYNPFCAYNDNWVCPLTPFENTLDVEIKAGEKNFS